MTTLAFSRACSRTIAWPIPLLPPVTVATLPLAVGQLERPLLDYRVLAVPQRQCKAQPLVIVTDTRETVLTPVIGARAGLVVAEMVPRVPVRAVVLADAAPLALTE